MKNLPAIKYPQGDWLNNQKQSFEEQIKGAQKAIDSYQFMINNNHPSANSLKVEITILA